MWEQYLITLGWALTGAISMAIGLGLSVKIFDWITPIEEWNLIEEGNVGAAILLSAVILGTALVVAFTVMP